ncbi:F-box domain-containing protein [Pycnococcus provasolii]
MPPAKKRKRDDTSQFTEATFKGHMSGSIEDFKRAVSTNPEDALQALDAVAGTAQEIKERLLRCSLGGLPQEILAEVLSHVPEKNLCEALSTCEKISKTARAVWRLKCIRIIKATCEQAAGTDTMPVNLPRTLAENEDTASAMKYLYDAPNMLNVSSKEIDDDDKDDDGENKKPRAFYQYLCHRLHWQVMARRVSPNRLQAPVCDQYATVGTSYIGGDASKLTYIERAQCVGWLLEVGDEYDLPARTMHLAVSYLDRALGCAQLSMLSTRSGGKKKAVVSRNNVQLIGTACLALALAHHRGFAAAAGDKPPTRHDDGTVTTAPTNPPFTFFVELMDNAFTAHEIALACGMLLFHVLDDERALSAEVLVGPGCRFTLERWQALSKATLPARVLDDIDARRASQNGNLQTPAENFQLNDDTMRRADLALGPQGISVSEREASLRAGQNPAQSVRVAPSSDELRSLLCRLKWAHLEQPSRDWLPVFLSTNEWFGGDERGVTHYAKYLLELALVSPLGLKHRHADLAAAAAWLARFVSRMRFQPVPAPESGPDEVASAAATAVSKCHESMPARIGCAVDQIKVPMMPPCTLADGTAASPVLIHGFADAQCVPPKAVSSAIRTLACIAWDPKDVAGIVQPTAAGDDDGATMSTPTSSTRLAEDTAREIVRRICARYTRPCFSGVAEWNEPFNLHILLSIHSSPTQRDENRRSSSSNAKEASAAQVRSAAAAAADGGAPRRATGACSRCGDAKLAVEELEGF